MSDWIASEICDSIICHLGRYIVGYTVGKFVLRDYKEATTRTRQIQCVALRMEIPGLSKQHH